VEEARVDPGTYAGGAALVEGRFVPIGEARVPILDWGFLRSDATYDVVHVWRGSFFRQRLRMSLPYSREEIRDVHLECVSLSGLRDAYVEVVCTRGVPPPGSRDPRECDNSLFAFAVYRSSGLPTRRSRRGDCTPSSAGCNA